MFPKMKKLHFKIIWSFFKNLMKKRNKNLKEILSSRFYKSDKIEPGAAATLTIGDVLYDYARVDPRVLLGVSHAHPDPKGMLLRASGLEDINAPESLDNVFQFAKFQYLIPRQAKYLDPDSLKGLQSSDMGHVAEFVVKQQWQSEDNEVVTMPDIPNYPGADLFRFDIPYNVKWYPKAHPKMLEHFEEYPKIKIVTSTEAAKDFWEKHPDLAHMVEDSRINYAFVPVLQNTSNKAGKELFENDYLFDLAIPEVFGISYIIVTAKNAMYLYQGKTDLKNAFENVLVGGTARVAGMGVGSYVGSKLGGFIGDMFDQEEAGEVVGGLILSIGGLIGGKKIGDKILEEKCKKEKTDLERKLSDYLHKASEIHSKGIKIFKEKIKKTELLKKGNDFQKQLSDFLMPRMEDEMNYKKKSNNKLKKFTNDPKLINSSSNLLELSGEAVVVGKKFGVDPDIIPKERNALLKAFDKLKKILKKKGLI